MSIRPSVIGGLSLSETLRFLGNHSRSDHPSGESGPTRARALDWLMTDFEVADVLGCLGADLVDVARMTEELPPGLRVSAAQVELSSVTRANDPLSTEVKRLLTLIAHWLVET